MNKGRLLVAALLCGMLGSLAQAQQSVPGKIFVAELDGAVTFAGSGKALGLKKGDSAIAQGVSIETGQGGSAVVVYSNGTSLFVDQNTHIEINRFTQVPFPSSVNIAAIEPSISDTLATVRQGRVVVTTNQLATGTSMIYLTPQSQVKIRGKEVVIEVTDQKTRLLVISGDATVTPQNAGPDTVGQTVHGGQMAIVQIQVVPIDEELAKEVAPKVAAAERAQGVVVFGTVTSNGTTDVQAQPVVPVNLPVPLTVSPSTLRTGG